MSTPPPVKSVTSVKSWTEFVTSVPPGAERSIPAMYDQVWPTGSARYPPIGSGEKVRPFYHLVKTPVTLYCGRCDSSLVFQPLYDKVNLGIQAAVLDVFLTYQCRNCRESYRTISIRLWRDDDETLGGRAQKFGEVPQFGPPLPNRLRELFGEDAFRLLKKGRQCENQALGIASHTYYRRVVDGQRVALLDAIARAAVRLNAPGDVLERLEEAKDESRFSAAIRSVSEAIPKQLLIKGHNPLTLLYGTLSEGVHDMSDEECLAAAHSIRVVLSDLADRIADVIKDEAELDAAISELLKGRGSATT